MGRGDGVEGTADVQEGRKAVRTVIDVSFDVVRKRGRSRLHRFVTAEAVLLPMERGKEDTLLDMPRAETFQGLEEVVGEGDGTIGGGMGVVFPARLGEEDHTAFPPKAWGVA